MAAKPVVSPFCFAALLAWLVLPAPWLKAKDTSSSNQQQPTPLERVLEQAARPNPTTVTASKGSLYAPGSFFEDLASDLRARHVNDTVTILVAERASALARGSTKTARSAAASAKVSAVGGITRATGPLANLLNLSGEHELDAQGSTSRQTVVSTTITARVVEVLPNGFLVVEGSKSIQVNDELQTVSIRGLVRPYDLSPDNVVTSDRVGLLEVKINGKGVVDDAIRRPNFLFRLLMRLLPF